MRKFLKGGQITRHDDYRFIPYLELMEGRSLPASTIIGAFGAGAGGGPLVTVSFDDGSHVSFFAFDPSFRGGVSVATGDVNGTGIPDVIVGAGPGGGPAVKVFDGAQLVAGHVVATASFFAFAQNFQGGVALAVGPVNGTSHSDVVVGAGSGQSSEVKVFDGAQLAQGNAVATASFLAFPPGSDWVALAVGPVNGTGHSDVVVGSGFGAKPVVKVFDGAMLAQGKVEATADFLAYAPSWLGGVTVAAADVNGTGHDDVIVGPGPGGGPNVEVFDGGQLAQGIAVATASFYAFDPTFTGGVSLAAGDINGTGHADVIVGAGPGGGPDVKVFDGAQLATGQAVVTASFYAFSTAFTGGVQVQIASIPGQDRDNLNVVANQGGGPEVVIYNGAQLAAGNFSPQESFFAFDPSFRGGINLGFVFAASYFDPSFVEMAPAANQDNVHNRHEHSRFGRTTSGFFFNGGGFFTNGFGSNSSGGFSGGSGGFSGGSGGSSGGSGGSGGGSGSLKAASAGNMSLGGKGQGGGLYLAPGELTLAALSNPKNTSSGQASSTQMGLPGGELGPTATPGELRATIENAISLWDQAGIDPAQDRRLRDVHYIIVDLDGDTLGRTTLGGFIHLSPTAAGYGWSVDSTGSVPAGNMDLTTVITHEMGLVLGLKETPTPGDIMNPYLAAGVQVKPNAHDLDGLNP